MAWVSSNGPVLSVRSVLRSTECGGLVTGTVSSPLSLTYLGGH
jgi:hypothetical protein